MAASNREAMVEGATGMTAFEKANSPFRPTRDIQTSGKRTIRIRSIDGPPVLPRTRLFPLALYCFF